MPSKPINYVLEVKIVETVNKCRFRREQVYGIYSCRSKAEKDVEEMKKYYAEKYCEVIGYRIFTLPNGCLYLHEGVDFTKQPQDKALSMTD